MMRRLSMLALMLPLLLGSTGCIIAMGHLGHHRGSRQAVSANGKVYIVNVRTGYVQEIDPLAIDSAEIIIVDEISTDVD